MLMINNNDTNVDSNSNSNNRNNSDDDNRNEYDDVNHNVNTNGRNDDNDDDNDNDNGNDNDNDNNDDNDGDDVVTFRKNTWRYAYKRDATLRKISDVSMNYVTLHTNVTQSNNLIKRDVAKPTTWRSEKYAT